MFFLYFRYKGCWAKDPHKRPSFGRILEELEAIAVSGFGETPNESFHTMQDGWKKEIAEVLHELRIKEKVNNCCFESPLNSLIDATTNDSQ